MTWPESFVVVSFMSFIAWSLNFIFGCKHKWEVVAKGDNTLSSGVKYGTWYDLRCEKCGNMKTMNL